MEVTAVDIERPQTDDIMYLLANVTVVFDGEVEITDFSIWSKPDGGINVRVPVRGSKAKGNQYNIVTFLNDGLLVKVVRAIEDAWMKTPKAQPKQAERKPGDPF